MAHTRIRAVAATAMLRDDHRKVKELFSQYRGIGEESVADSKLELFEEIRKELTIHAQLEEEIFYPAVESLRGADEAAGGLVREAREEHQAVRTLLDELADLQPGDEKFDERMKALHESVTEHADKEEEEIFPCFEELSRDARSRVSEALRIRKAELAEEYDEE